MLIITNNINGDTYNRALTSYEKSGLKDFVRKEGLNLEPQAEMFFQAIVNGNYETAEVWMTDTLELLLFNWWMENNTIRYAVHNYREYLTQKRYDLY